MWLGGPCFADGLVWREAVEGLEAFGEVVGIKEGREVSLELPACAVVVAPDGGFLEGAVLALDPAHWSRGDWTW